MKNQVPSLALFVAAALYLVGHAAASARVTLGRLEDGAEGGTRAMCEQADENIELSRPPHHGERLTEGSGGGGAMREQLRELKLRCTCTCSARVEIAMYMHMLCSYYVLCHVVCGDGVGVGGREDGSYSSAAQS